MSVERELLQICVQQDIKALGRASQQNGKPKGSSEGDIVMSPGYNSAVLYS
jgi:hypothetical protein